MKTAEVEGRRRRREEVAGRRARRGDVVDARVDARQADRLGVDVGQQHLGGEAALGEPQPGQAGAAADVDGEGRRSGLALEQAQEAVAVGAEEDRVALARREGRVRQQEAAQRREADAAPEPAVRAGRDRAGGLQELEQRGPDDVVLGSEGAAPAEDVAQIARPAQRRPGHHAFVRGGRDGGEGVAGAAQRAAHLDQRLIGARQRGLARRRGIARRPRQGRARRQRLVVGTDHALVFLGRARPERRRRSIASVVPAPRPPPGGPRSGPGPGRRGDGAARPVAPGPSFPTRRRGAHARGGLTARRACLNRLRSLP
ncbi:MAG: hypothetical protein U1F43_13405 [Myxococcota bacterium]